MGEDDFLAHFITEDIYIIDKHRASVSETETLPLNTRPLILTPVPLNDEESAFLEKVFSAVGIDSKEIDREILQDEIDSQRQIVFFFGEAPVPLNPYEITRSAAQTLVLTDSLLEIARDQPKKRALWGVLKAVFT